MDSETARHAVSTVAGSAAAAFFSIRPCGWYPRTFPGATTTPSTPSTPSTPLIVFPSSPVLPTCVGAVLYIYVYIYIYIHIKKCPSDGRPPGSVDGRPRSPPSAWLEDLLERLPSKSSKHTRKVCQSHQASLPSKSSKQVFHPSTCLEDLLGRHALET